MILRIGGDYKMDKKIVACILCVSLFLLVFKTKTLFAFDRVAAVEYADRYFENYNDVFPAWPADCTNFISQCLLAGNTRYDLANGFKPDGVLIRVKELGEELLAHHGALWDDIRPLSLQTGDVLFLLRDMLFFEAEKEHAMIITETSPDKYNAHTDSHFHKLVSDIDLADNIFYKESLRYFLLPDAKLEVVSLVADNFELLLFTGFFILIFILIFVFSEVLSLRSDFACLSSASITILYFAPTNHFAQGRFQSTT